MNGFELLEWLRALPEEKLKKTKIFLEIAGGDDKHELITTKYYHEDGKPVIYLVEK